MVLYNKDGQQLLYSDSQKINGKTHGNIYKISDTECLKVYKRGNEANLEVLELIKNLYLKNYYEILDFYYNKKGSFKGHTMKYYKEEEIDILTMPTEYTLDNLFNIERSANTLTNNNMQIEDTHTENIILTSEKIVVIDVDLYSLNKFYSKLQLELKNLRKIHYLFKELFIEALTDYHSEYKTQSTSIIMAELFDITSPIQVEKTYNKLVKYKYPIDYIRKRHC